MIDQKKQKEIKTQKDLKKSSILVKSSKRLKLLLGSLYSGESGAFNLAQIAGRVIPKGVAFLHV